VSTEPILLKKCITCEKEKDVKHFHKSSHYKDGRQSRCKICKLYGKSKQPHKHIKVEKDSWANNFSLAGCKDADFCKSYKLLTLLGYSVEGNVHLQFCEKYGLEPKKKQTRDENRIKYFECL
jgi:hypothetical protein